MLFDRRQFLKTLSTGLVAGAASTALSGPVFAQQKKLRIAMVVKVLGISYFDVTHDGGQLAANDLGDVELTYTGPTAATVEQQIAVLDTLIAQKVDAIVISANDQAALVPTTKKAMQRGLTVVSEPIDGCKEGWTIVPKGGTLRATRGSRAVVSLPRTERAAA